jgi:hypothetical protein
LQIAFLALLTQYSAPAYGDGYEYSKGAIAGGVFVGMLPVIAMIAAGIVAVAYQDGSLLQV